MSATSGKQDNSLMGLHTKLAIFRAPEGIKVPLAVHYHTELCAAGDFDNGLPVVLDL